MDAGKLILIYYDTLLDERRDFMIKDESNLVVGRMLLFSSRWSNQPLIL